MFLFSQAVGTMVWTSFGDLVLYLHQAGSPLPLDNAATWTSLLENLRASGRQDPVGSKVGFPQVSRALHGR